MFRSPPGLDRHRLSEQRAKAGGDLVLARLLLLLRLLRFTCGPTGGWPASRLLSPLIPTFRSSRRKGERLGLRLCQQELHALSRGEPGLHREGNRPSERDGQEGPDRSHRRISRDNREVERTSPRKGKVGAELRVVHREDVAMEDHPAFV